MRMLIAATLACAALLSGCAGLSTVSSDVSSFGDWPAERAPGTYAFDRLPSQQAQAQTTGLLEDAARLALLKAGFRPADEGQAPDVLVQVGARSDRLDYYHGPWSDPFLWHGGYGYWGRGPWIGPGWGMWTYYDTPRYVREVAVLIRDRASGKPLFEARASNDGLSQSDPAIFAAMFEAALMDFPRLGVNPRRVVVELGP